MDINANVRERIALYRKGAWTELERVRMNELIRAGREWRAMGGFTADILLVEEMRTLRVARLRELH